MRLSVQMRLLAAFAVVVALMLTIGLFALARLGGENQDLRELALKVVPSTRAVGDINAKMNQYRKDQLHYIVARPQDRPLSAPDSIEQNLIDDLATMRAYLRSYRSHGLIEDRTDRRLLNTFQADFFRYVALSAPFQRLADEGHDLLASEAMGDGAADAMYSTLKVVIEDWSEHKVQVAAAAEAASQSSYSLSVVLILALLAVAVMIALVVAILLARRMTIAVREIGTAAKAISRGDIEQHVAVGGHDEFGEMAQDFDSMIEYLRSTVAVAETIAEGNLEIEVQPRSERDALGNALVTMTESLRSVVGENDRLLAASREEANTDALTGLPNRRALMRDLEAGLVQAGEGQQLMLALLDLDGFKHYNDTFGHAAGDALLVRLADRLKRALTGSAVGYRMGGDEFCVLAATDRKGGAAIARQAASAMSAQGEAFTIGCSYGVANLPDDAFLASDALRVADQRMYEQKTGRRSAGCESTNVLLKVLGERSPGLLEHISMVAQLAVATANGLALSEPEVRRIELAAQLHDIGKVAIPDTILNKPGPLDNEEWEFMRRHTQIGERILSAAPSLAHAAQLVRSHHERYDGSGYPDGLAGDEIPIEAYIIAVCDAFGAMTAERPYSDAISVADALVELKAGSGSQFHPHAVKAFCELIENPEHSVPLTVQRP